MTAAEHTPRREALIVFLVAGEESGDQLGAALMRAIKQKAEGRVRFCGVGGDAMAREGLASIFPLQDLSLMGLGAVLKVLPRVLLRMRQTVRAIDQAKPDVLVIIDSPDFTHWVAAAARRADPQLPIVNYVSPSVWAWRSGRARRMRRYIDHVLALLPFEPAAYERLAGPACSYVGHPLQQEIAALRSSRDGQGNGVTATALAVLPGSRNQEVRRLLPHFMATARRLRAEIPDLQIVIPTLPHLADAVLEIVARSDVTADVVVGADERRATFRRARAALAASGTVTLELALAGVPMVVAYKVAGWEAAIARRIIRVPTIVLANLVLGENVVSQFVQEDCTAEKLARALMPLVHDTPQRARQIEAFARLDHIMEIGTRSPSERAAEIVLSLARVRPMTTSVAPSRL
ncbi:MAG: lipid-A-disaccharide synthase, partial [Variibacter sp.]|nr:lipid-A-disaccharide synthase [Variibacter sp.]